MHEESLKACLPFNKDRYLKRNYRQNTSSRENEKSQKVEELGPDLDELEGKPIEPEPIEDNFSEFSSEKEFNQKKNETIMTEKIKEKLHNHREEEKEAENTEENEDDDSFSEFEDVLNNVENYEHQKANDGTEKSY